MLEISYKRQMDRNYMVIKGEEGVLQPDYEMRMLSENEISGFMKLCIMPVDCHLEYCYDISSMQPLSRLYQKRKLGLEEIKTLMFSLNKQMEQMNVYLLEGYHLFLKPEYIYIQPQSFQVSFCYYTEVKIDFWQSLRELIQFMLEKLNHEDQNGIVAVYQMYQRSLEETITLEELLKILFDSSETKEEQQRLEQTVFPEDAQIKATEPTIWNGEVIGEPYKNVQTVWCYEEKKKRIGLLICSVVVFLGIGIWFILKGMWRETESFLLFLSALTLGLLYHIWNIQQMKKADESQWSQEVEQSSELLVISYKDEKQEEVHAMDALEKKKESIPGDTGPLQKQEAHAFISQNPGLWSHIQINQYPFIIGRIPDGCNVVLNFPEISRLHGELQRREEEIWLMDLNSTNGTYVNGIRLEANTPVLIKSGDKICFAHISYIFH